MISVDVEPYVIGADGWLVGVERRPHHEWKAYPQVNSGIGMAFHSAEGWYHGSMPVLDDPLRGSWKWFNKLTGDLVQHCSIWCSCWASGNALANTSLWAVESEGLWHTEITTAQLRTNLRLVKTWELFRKEEATRTGGWGTGRTMFEHRDVATLITPNAGPTACPSERYAPLWEALADGGTEVARIEALESQVRLLTEVLTGHHGLTPESRLAASVVLANWAHKAPEGRLATWDDPHSGWSLLGGYRDVKENLLPGFERRIGKATELVADHILNHGRQGGEAEEPEEMVIILNGEKRKIRVFK